MVTAGGAGPRGAGRAASAAGARRDGRLRPVAAGLAAVLLLAAGLVRVHAQEAARRPLVHAVGAVGLTVSDLDRAVAFYTGVLGFERVGEAEAWGDEAERLQGVFALQMRVALTEYLTPRGRPIPADSCSHDRWFQHVAIIVSDMDRAYAWLRRHRVEHASPAPQRLPDWNPSAGGIRAFYFKDPDGHPLEVLEFPRGKGDPRWQDARGRVFLGIDHTAIVVADTETSLRCYRDVLGLRVAGSSENWGPEQERLNQVFGARLRITTLRPRRGPASSSSSTSRRATAARSRRTSGRTIWRTGRRSWRLATSRGPGRPSGARRVGQCRRAWPGRGRPSA
jgi:catechol 2,3-dioxygenase-like lactoylglutathione lyase family enzyme